VAVVLSLFVLLITGEVTARLMRGRLFSTQHVMSATLLSVEGAGCPTRYDSLTGWVNSPGSSKYDDRFGVTYNIDGQGFRSNGQPRPNGPAILCVGDSFTFGDEVADADTFSASLERELSLPVYNAGVVNFGFDQIVLEAERRVEQLQPDILVVAIISADVLRCQYSSFQGCKPWFSVKDGILKHEYNPVPSIGQSGFVSKVFGYSHLIVYLSEFTPSLRRRVYGEHRTKVEHDDERVAFNVGRLLVHRLSHLRSKTSILVVALPRRGERVGARLVLDESDRCSLESVDLLDSVALYGIESHPTAGQHGFIASELLKASVFQSLID